LVSFVMRERDLRRRARKEGGLVEDMLDVEGTEMGGSVSVAIEPIFWMWVYARSLSSL